MWPDSAVRTTCTDVLSGPCQSSRRRCGGVLVATFGHCHGPLSAWNGSWNDEPDNPSAASAIRAITRVIGAGRALVASGRTSCKRQVSGSIPLTGSQVRERTHRVFTALDVGLDIKGL